jgi:flagellar secretion chaperone FliS
MADIYKQYRESEVLQADPVKLVTLMLDGALRFARQAKKAIDDSRVEDAHNYILRTYAIIAELMATLDFKQGQDIAAQLEQVYDYILHLLKEANIRKDGQLLEQVIKVLEPLAQTWHDAFTAKMPDPPEGSNQQTAAANPASKLNAQKPLDLVG